MPTIESYKKQAKQFVRWHRDREWTVAQLIREHVPRFAKSSDRQILAAAFKLADAQQIVARRAGFASWSELKAGATKEVSSPVVQSSERQLRTALAHVFVTDITRAAAFYRDKLDFAIVFTYGEPPYFGELRCDGARFFLRQVDAVPIPESERRKQHWISVAIEVATRDQLKKLYAKYRAAAVPMYQPLKKHPWGQWEFVAVDPDGNLVSFAAS